MSKKRPKRRPKKRPKNRQKTSKFDSKFAQETTQVHLNLAKNHTKRGLGVHVFSSENFSARLSLLITPLS